VRYWSAPGQEDVTDASAQTEPRGQAPSRAQTQPPATTDVAAERSTVYTLRRTMVVAVVTRLATAAVALAATYALGVRPAPWAHRLPRLAEPFHGVLAHLLNPWAVWDGVWFIKISANGYAANDGSVAFFPLYPLVTRWVGILFGNNLVLAGMTVSLVCYFVGVWLLFRLVEREFGDRIAYRTCLYLSIFPTAFFWQAVYSESMFLALSVACILWSREGRWKLAGLAGLAAALTRSAGFLLIVPMAISYLEQHDWRPSGADSDAASLLMIPEGLMVWMAYLALSFGRPLLFAQAQEQWKRSLAVPTYALWKGLVAGVQGARQLLSGQTAHEYWPAPDPGAVMPLAAANVINLGAVAFAIAFIVYGLKRLPIVFGTYAAVTVGYPLLFPAESSPFMSMPRFILAAFPIFMALAVATDRRPRTHIVVCTIFVIGLILLTAKFAIFSWVA